jgi:hypothetical protein
MIICTHKHESNRRKASFRWRGPNLEVVSILHFPDTPGSSEQCLRWHAATVHASSTNISAGEDSGLEALLADFVRCTPRKCMIEGEKDETASFMYVNHVTRCSSLWWNSILAARMIISACEYPSQSLKRRHEPEHGRGEQLRVHQHRSQQ